MNSREGKAKIKKAKDKKSILDGSCDQSEAKIKGEQLL